MRIITIVCLLALFNSCIREEMEPCPPLQVNITVKDKNYSNIDKVDKEVWKSEDLAFRAYVPTLYYILRNIETDKIITEQGVFNVTGEDKSFPITFSSNMPFGKYALTVWGGLSSQTPLNNKALSAILHDGGKEGDDLYLTNDTLVYNADNYTYTVGMQRTKGKLIIQADDLPQEVIFSSQSIDHIFGSVDTRFNYGTPTTVSTQDKWNAAPEIITDVMLAPSSEIKNSRLHISFYDVPDRVIPKITPQDVNITIKRNELTVLKYIYDDESRDFAIYQLIDDSWEMINQMGIE